VVWARDQTTGDRDAPALDRMAVVMTCNACNVTFSDEAAQKVHYRCDWHRYNLKRKVSFRSFLGVSLRRFLAFRISLGFCSACWNSIAYAIAMGADFPICAEVDIFANLPSGW
jgi:hypothetical protein